MWLAGIWKLARVAFAHPVVLAVDGVEDGDECDGEDEPPPGAVQPASMGIATSATRARCTRRIRRATRATEKSLGSFVLREGRTPRVFLLAAPLVFYGRPPSQRCLIEGSQTDIPVAVVGAGGFGTCLAALLARNGDKASGREVRLWCRSEEYAQTIANTRENPKYLPGVKLPLSVWVTSSLQDAVAGAEVVVAAVPSQGMRETARAFAPHLERGAKVLSVAKGIEHDSFLRMSEVLQQELGAGVPVAAMSGPNFADEIARGTPSATVIASKNASALNLLCELLSNSWFKAYPRRDVVGVELGGVMKNISAVAAGVTKGIGFGENSQAAVITLGLDEMVRFGVAHGARRETFTGLSGLGDLICTATSSRSRNHRVGELLGRGLKLREAMATMGGQVAEGVHATRFVHEQAAKEGIPLPLTAEIYRILYEGKDVRKAVTDLLALL